VTDESTEMAMRSRELGRRGVEAMTDRIRFDALRDRVAALALDRGLGDLVFMLSTAALRISSPMTEDEVDGSLAPLHDSERHIVARCVRDLVAALQHKETAT
jgi:hypothetical protein